jgi:hypothetical protein
MGKRKRTSRRTGLVDRAVRAGRRALKEAESRVPPDLRRQVERRLKDADKTARAAIKQLQAQVRRASTRADVNSVLKRIDGLTRQARQIATGSGARTPATRSRATTRRPTSARTRKAAPARRAAPTRKTSTARAATTSRTATPRRRRAAAPAPEVEEVVIPVAEVGEVEVYEITER